MQRILLHVPASQGLVVREDHGVVLDVALVRPLVDPAGVLGHGGAEPPHVVAVHVELGPAAHHPLGELVPAPAAQHHARAVEADAVEQSSDSGILSHDGLVVRCERLWATDCALDTGLKLSVKREKDDLMITLTFSRHGTLLTAPSMWTPNTS